MEPRDRPAASDLSAIQKEQLAHLEEQQLELTDFYVLTDPKGASLYDVLLFAGSDGAVFATGTSTVVALVAQGGADAEDGATSVWPSTPSSRRSAWKPLKEATEEGGEEVGAEPRGRGCAGGRLSSRRPRAGTGPGMSERDDRTRRIGLLGADRHGVVSPRSGGT